MNTQDRFLNCAQAAAVLTELGLCSRDGGPVKERTVKGYAERGVLPFFVAPDGRRRIQEKELRAQLQRMQYDAVRKK